MGILDDLVEGIGREISKVQARSQEMLQTYNLSNQIRSLEGKITALFIDIGRLVYDKYERNSDVGEEMLQDKVHEIVELEREIVDLKAQLEALRAQFDPNAPASKKADSAAGYRPTPGYECPHCHAPADVFKSFCPACGGSLKDKESKDDGSGDGGGD